MPLIPRPKYRAKDWRLAMRTRERDEAVAMTKEARTWAIRMKRRALKAERTVQVLRESRTHWRASFERVLGERNELKDAINQNYHIRMNLIMERDKLAAALKKLWEVSHGYYLQEWMDIIDAALDGVENDEELINSTYGKYSSTTPLTDGLIDERKANWWSSCK